MRTVFNQMLAVASVALALSGCMTLPAAGTGQKEMAPLYLVPPDGKKAAAPTFVKLTPMSTYGDEWQDSTADGGAFSGAYTRVLIVSDVLANSVPDQDGNLVPAQGGTTLPYY